MTNLSCLRSPQTNCDRTDVVRTNAEADQAFAPYPHRDLVLTGVVAASILIVAARGLMSVPATSDIWWGFAIGLALGVPGVLGLA